jgi:hypothetical protein
MDRIILDDIPFEVEETGLAELLRIQPGSRSAPEFSKILGEARLVARPKAAFAVATGHMIEEDTMEIGGVHFTSRVLRINLDKAGIIFPFVATCGTELEDWSRNMTSMLHSFWADSIMLMALGCAVSRLETYLKRRLGSEATLSTMNPGSLPDWPLEEQAALFSLLGDSAAVIGTRLTGKMVIQPIKSVSGIHFVSEDEFVNCSLCPRSNCPSRRADYKADLYATKYGKQ